MERFKTACRRDVEWRIAEIALIKKSAVALGQTSEMVKSVRRYAVPALYAVWEGFVTTVFSEYAKRINRKKLLFDKVNINIARHVCFDELKLLSISTSAEKRKELVVNMRKLMRGRLVIPEDVRTNSNVDYAEIVKIMSRYGVDPVEEAKYKNRLQEFLGYRNCIAHGNHGVIIEMENLDNFASLIEDLMEDISDRLNNSLRERSYLKESISELCSL